MANVSNIVIDLGAQTAVLTITNASNPVETITYTNSLNQISFAPRSLINISAADFLNYLSQFAIFQTAILFNFPQYTGTTPFTFMENVETNNTGSNQWDFYSVVGYSPTGRTVDYACLGSNNTANLNNRQFTITLNFPEWLYLLQALNHFQASATAFF